MFNSNTQVLRIEQIRKHVTIFEVLTRMGHNYEEATQQIRCPFHDDHSPSARVYADQNKVYCFTEQRSWDVIDAVQTWQRLPTIEDACAWIEREFAVPGVVQSLQGSLRAQLTRTLPPQVQEAVTMVETRLREQRRYLGFERYTKLLMALDLTVYQQAERLITPVQCAAQLSKVLQAART